ncbi:putative ATP-dependent RNA helicase DDX43 [Solea senegalensis]|uniref:ATP-dependent RNA helicase DDX43 n=1 Tax=Solea senegalensis TaxID=28829 RepID=A0AAV6S2P4_SOLSE|nr:putative ATP-dependent RNA helicase DDX43 [Solea senegalensis]
MSDWEEEDGDCAASQNVGSATAIPEWRFQGGDPSRGNTFGLRREGRFSASRGERGDFSGEYRNRRGGGNDLPSVERRGPGQRSHGNENSDSSPPVTLSVETALIGRIIGRGGSKIRELEETSGARIKL